MYFIASHDHQRHGTCSTYTIRMWIWRQVDYVDLRARRDELRALVPNDRSGQGIFSFGFGRKNDATTTSSDDSGSGAEASGAGDPLVRANAVREMKLIDGILDAYTAEQLHLGEAALVMVQIVDYDIPAIRSSQQRIASQMSELERKSKENRRMAAAASVKFRKICADMKITGVASASGNESTGDGASTTRIESKICKGLSEVIERDLSALLKRVATLIGDDILRDAANFYSEFVEEMHPDFCEKSIGEEAKGKKKKGGGGDTQMKDRLVLLEAYETFCSLSTVGDAVKLPSDRVAAYETDALCDAAYDFDALGGDGDEAELEIDWGFEVEDVGENVGEDEPHELEIGDEWQIDEIRDADEGVVELDVSEDIDIVGESGFDARDMMMLVDEGGVGTSSQDESQGNNDPTEAADAGPTRLSFLADSDSRNRLVDDLTELWSFISQRVEEESLGLADVNSKIVGVTKLRGYAEHISEALALLKDDTSRDLILTFSSEKFFRRKVSDISSLGVHEAKLEKNATDALARIDELKVQLIKMTPKLDSLKQHVKAVKAMAEAVRSIFTVSPRVPSSLCPLHWCNVVVCLMPTQTNLRSLCLSLSRRRL